LCSHWDYRHTHTLKENIMSNKSGFEIRADLLNQAQSILTDNYYSAVSAIQYNNEVSGEKNPIPIRNLTPEDVINTARQLYEFVNEKNRE